MQRLRQRKGIWECAYYDLHGVMHRESTHQTDRRAAENYLRVREREATDPRTATARTPKTVTKALEEFLVHPGDIKPPTLKIHQQKAARLMEHIGGLNIHTLKRTDLEKYVQLRREQAYQGKLTSDHTIEKELRTLRQALHRQMQLDNWDGSWERISPGHSAGYVPRKRWLTPEQYAMLRAALPPERRLWVDVAVYTGGRDSEIESLSWDDVRFADNDVHICGTKTGGADRRVPLHPDLRAILLAERSDGSGNAQHRATVVEPWKYVNNDLKRLCKRIGLQHTTPNDLRRTFGSWLKQAKVDSLTVARLMGHASTQMIERVYGQLDQKTLSAAIETLPTIQVSAPKEQAVRLSRWGLIEVD